MSKPIVSSGRSRFAAIALGIAALSLALPLSAHADGKNHGRRHENHSRNYYQGDDGYYGPPAAYYGGPPPCRGPKHVRVYNNYYPVPVAVPVYPAYPQPYPSGYPSSGGNAVVRIGVDWVFGF